MPARRDFTREVRPHQNRAVRWILIGVGLVFAGLGIAGVVLPLLPGMPFLLIAAACFARTNDRFYNWLLNHRVVGPPLHAWRNHRRIPKRVKPRAIAAVLLAFGLSSWLALGDPLLQALWMGLGLLVVLLIAGLPSYDESLTTTRDDQGSRDDGTATENAH
jgi:hypothetical protein